MASEALTAAIKKQYDDQGRREVEVPEWNMTIWATPLTLGDKARIHEFTAGAAGKQYLVFAQILIMKAEDEAGNKLFSQKDFELLTKHSDPQVVSTAAANLTKDDPDSEVAAIKNA